MLYSFTINLIWYGTVIVYFIIDLAIYLCNWYVVFVWQLPWNIPLGDWGWGFLISSIFENGYEILKRIQIFDQGMPTWRAHLLLYSINWLEYTQHVCLCVDIRCHFCSTSVIFCHFSENLLSLFYHFFKLFCYKVYFYNLDILWYTPTAMLALKMFS